MLNTIATYFELVFVLHAIYWCQILVTFIYVLVTDFTIELTYLHWVTSKASKIGFSKQFLAVNTNSNRVSFRALKLY